MADIPEFYTDPYFSTSQATLLPFYSDILKGDIPEFYRPLTEYGGRELEDILGLLKRDVSTSVYEDLARRKVRGVRGADIISRAMGDISTKTRWSDYMRALEGRQFLLGLGTKGLEGVRSAGLEYGGQKNIFDLKTYEMEEAKKAEEAAMWSDILSSTMQGGASMFGLHMLGKTLKSPVKLGSAGGSST